MKKLLVISAAAVALAGCEETVYTAAPSVFPPVEGPIVLPSQAQGFYQGGFEFRRALSAKETAIWKQLTPQQRVRAAIFINSGGTLTSSLKGDL